MSFELIASTAYPGSYYLYADHSAGAVALVKKTDDGYEIRTRSDVRTWHDGIEL